MIEQIIDSVHQIKDRIQTLEIANEGMLIQEERYQQIIEKLESIEKESIALKHIQEERIKQMNESLIRMQSEFKELTNKLKKKFII